MATGKRGLKLHSIIEKLSEQCERKSPLPDEEGEDVSSEVSNVKRKQRKGNEVKRVYKEASSRSDSDVLSDEDIDVETVEEESGNSKSLLKEQAWKTDAACVERKVDAYPRAAKKNARKKQTMKQQQKPETKALNNKNKKRRKRKNATLKMNISKEIKETSSSGSDRDLAIDIEAFVNHAPVLQDVDKAASLPCPFCSVLCQDVIQHIKYYHNSECAVVGHSDKDKESTSDEESDNDEEFTSDKDEEFASDKVEEMSDSSYAPDDVTDSEEDFNPYKKRKAKSKNKHTAKSQKQQNKKEADEISECELCIDVENVLNTGSGVNDIDGPCVQSTADEPTNHTAKCNKQGRSKNTPKFCCSCQGCGTRFHHWQDLRKHFDEKPDCRKLYQCEECGQICLTTSLLKKHKRVHSKERPYKCPICNAAFKEKSYLKRHSVTHTGVKDFKCDVCDKEFSHQRTLKEHRMRHTGERPYKCEHCEASFINSTSLKVHNTKHTGIRQYKCQACGKMFAKSYGLKMHSLSHSKDKPFVCEVCGKGFKRPDHFKQHQIIHSDSKPFKCDTCQRTFNQRVCLRKHLPCREHEKQQKKLQSSLAKQNKTKNKVKGERKPKGERKSRASNREKISQESAKSRTDAPAASDCYDVSNDVSLASSIDSCRTEGSLLAGSYSPPSFVRPTAKFVDSEYYSEPHERDFSPQHLTDRTVSSSMNSLLSLPHSMFGVEEPLSLDTLPPLSSHDTHALSGRPLSHDSSTDFGSVLLSSTMERDFSSIVAEARSFFGHE